MTAIENLLLAAQDQIELDLPRAPAALAAGARHRAPETLPARGRYWPCSASHGSATNMSAIFPAVSASSSISAAS